MRSESHNAEIGIYSTGKSVQLSTPATAQYVIDVAGLRDPQSSGGFRKRFENGLASEVQSYMREDSRIAAIKQLVELQAWLQFRSRFGTSNSKQPNWLSFLIRDHHGIWVAPAVAEILASHLSDLHYSVYTMHFGLPKGDVK